MSRLIDADAFAEKIKEISIRQGYYDFHPKSMSAGEILDSVIADLKGEGVCGFENAPTADAVPVVRCKDCKFYVEHSLFGVTQGWCERLCDEFDRSMARGTENDDFCSHGEKKVEV